MAWLPKDLADQFDEEQFGASQDAIIDRYTKPVREAASSAVDTASQGFGSLMEGLKSAWQGEQPAAPQQTPEASAGWVDERGSFPTIGRDTEALGPDGQTTPSGVGTPTLPIPPVGSEDPYQFPWTRNLPQVPQVNQPGGGNQDVGYRSSPTAPYQAPMPTAPRTPAVTFIDGRAEPQPSLRPGESVGSTTIVDGRATPPTSGGYAPSTTRGHEGVERWSPFVTEAAQAYGLPESTIKGLMEIESGGNPEAVSSAGAQGLMQVMPFHFKPGENPRDPRTNILRGAKVYADALAAWGDPDKAAAAYFGAIDRKGNITNATDGSSVDGHKYVALWRAAASKYGTATPNAGSAAAEQRSPDLGAGRATSVGGATVPQPMPQLGADAQQQAQQPMPKLPFSLVNSLKAAWTGQQVEDPPPYDPRLADSGAHEATPGSVGSQPTQLYGPPESEAGPVQPQPSLGERAIETGRRAVGAITEAGQTIGESTRRAFAGEKPPTWQPTPDEQAQQDEADRNTPAPGPGRRFMETFENNSRSALAGMVSSLDSYANGALSAAGFGETQAAESFRRSRDRFDQLQQKDPRYRARDIDFSDPATYADPDTYAAVAGQVFPSVLAAMATGGLAGAVLKGVGISGAAPLISRAPALGDRASWLGSALFTLPTAAGSTYEDLKKLGASDQQAFVGANISGALQAALETVNPHDGLGAVTRLLKSGSGSGSFTRRLLGAARDLVGGALKEGSEEASQQLADNAVQKWFGSDKSWFDQVPQNFVVGALGGLGMGAPGAALHVAGPEAGAQIQAGVQAAGGAVKGAGQAVGREAGAALLNAAPGPRMAEGGGPLFSAGDVGRPEQPKGPKLDVIQNPNGKGWIVARTEEGKPPEVVSRHASKADATQRLITEQKRATFKPIAREAGAGTRDLAPEELLGGYARQDAEAVKKGRQSSAQGGMFDEATTQSSAAPEVGKAKGKTPESAPEASKSEQPTKHEYSSTQLDLPKKLADSVKRQAARIDDADLAPDGRDSHPHVTAFYGLTTENADDVRRIVEAHAPITVKLGKTSVFADENGRGSDVVKVDVDSLALHALNADLAKLPNGNEYPDFHPHVTLGYVRPGKGKKYAGSRALEGQSATIDSLTFSSKTGEQVTIPLKGEAAPAMPKVTPTLRKAYADWSGNRAYIDDRGNYHVKRDGKSSGPIAPWSREVRNAFPNVTAFYEAAAHHAEQSAARKVERTRRTVASSKPSDAKAATEAWEVTDEDRAEVARQDAEIAKRPPHSGYLEDPSFGADETPSRTEVEPTAPTIADITRNSANPKPLPMSDAEALAKRLRTLFPGHHVDVVPTGRSQTRANLRIETKPGNGHSLLVDNEKARALAGETSAPFAEPFRLLDVRGKWTVIDGKLTDEKGKAWAERRGPRIWVRPGESKPIRAGWIARNLDRLEEAYRAATGEGAGPEKLTGGWSAAEQEARRAELRKNLGDDPEMLATALRLAKAQVESTRGQSNRGERARFELQAIEDLVREQQPPEQETPAPQTDEPAPQPSAPSAEAPAQTAGLVGNETMAMGTTDPSHQYPLRWKAVELDSLTPSHTDTLAPHPDFPTELQPRDRSRAATRTWLAETAAKFAPEALLTDTLSLPTSAPIVTKEGTVLSGNGRVLLLRQLEQREPEKYAAYRRMAEQRARAFGIDPEALKGMHQPILVREILIDFANHDELVEFAHEANADPTAGMGAGEQAKADARLIDAEDLARLDVPADGDVAKALKSAGNVEWVREIAGRFPSGDRGTFWQKGGEISTEGVARLRSAIFARVFGGEYGARIQENYLESPRPEDRTIGQAIEGALVDLAKLDGSIAAGLTDARYAGAERLARAILIRASARNNGVPLDDELAKLPMPETGVDAPDALTVQLARLFNRMARSPAQLREVLQEYAREALREPPPGQSMMFSDREARPETEVLEDAIRTVGERRPAKNNARGPQARQAAPAGARSEPAAAVAEPPTPQGSAASTARRPEQPRAAVAEPAPVEAPIAPEQPSEDVRYDQTESRLPVLAAMFDEVTFAVIDSFLPEDAPEGMALAIYNRLVDDGKVSDDGQVLTGDVITSEAEQPQAPPTAGAAPEPQVIEGTVVSGSSKPSGPRRKPPTPPAGNTPAPPTPPPPTTNDNPGAERPEDSGDAANASLGRQYGTSMKGESARLTPSKIASIRRAYVRAMTDDKIDLNMLVEEIEREHGPLPAALRVDLLARMSPGMAAKVTIDEGLKPHLKGLSEADLAWLDVFLTHMDNLDVARAMGIKAEKATIDAAGPFRGKSWQRLQTERQRLRAFSPGGIAPDAKKATESAKRVRQLERQVQRDEVKHQQQIMRRAGKRRSRVESERLFSEGLTVGDSHRALGAMARELGPKRLAKLQKAAAGVWEFNRSLLDAKVENDVISRELYDELVNRYPHYVPTRIVDYMGDGDTGGVAVGKSLSLNDTGLRRNTLEGTARRRENPLASTYRNAIETERVVKQNQVALAMKMLIESDPDGLGQEFRPAPSDYTLRSGEGYLTGYEGGVKFRYVTGEPMAKAMKVVAASPVHGFFRGFMHFWKELITRSPLFIAYQVPQDAASYVMREHSRAGGNPLALPGIIADLATSYGIAFRGLASGEYKGSAASYLKSGGGMAGFNMKDVDTAKEKVYELTGRPSLARLIKQGVLFEWAQAIGERTELAPRVASYRRAKASGESEVQAVIEGRDVTLDFLRGGYFARYLNGLLGFFNVGAQASASIPRMWKENPRGFALMSAMMLGSAVLLEAAMSGGDDEDDWNDLPKNLKDRGLLFPTGGISTTQEGERRQRFVMLPVRELAPLLIVGREIVRRYQGKEGRDALDLVLSTAMAASPIQANSASDLFGGFFPELLATPAQLAMDQDFFRGGPIKTKRNDEQASNLAKGVTNALQWIGDRNETLRGLGTIQPSQVEFAARGFGGNVARTAGAASDVGKDRGQQDRGPIDTPLIGGLVNRFVTDAGGERLRAAQEEKNLISLDMRKALREAKVNAPIGPVQGTIEGVSLRRSEQARYQELANRYTDQELRKIAPRLAGSRPADRTLLVKTAITDARTRARYEILRSIPSAEQGRRLREADQKKAS